MYEERKEEKQKKQEKRKGDEKERGAGEAAEIFRSP